MADEQSKGNLKVRNVNATTTKPKGHRNRPKPKPNATATMNNSNPKPQKTMDLSDVSIEIVGNIKTGRKVIQEHFNFNLDQGDQNDDGNGNNKKIFMTMDCEGQNLGVNGRLTLLQISLNEKTVFLFDILTCPKLIDLLQPILESKNIVKILHDCRGDKANLKKEFGVNLNCIFDTQVAYKLTLASPDAKRIGFNALCLQLNVIGNCLKENFKSNMKVAKFWNFRPLTTDMINYAAMDVLCLWGVFHQLDRNLGADGSRLRANFYKNCAIYSNEKLNNAAAAAKGYGRSPGGRGGGNNNRIFEQNKATLVSKENCAEIHLLRVKKTRENAIGISVLRDENDVHKSIRYLAISSLRRQSVFDLKLLPQNMVDRIKDLLRSDGSTMLTKVMFDTEDMAKLENDYGIEISDIFQVKKEFCQLNPKEATAKDWDLFTMCKYYFANFPNMVVDEPKSANSQTINQIQQARDNYILKTLEAQMKMLFFLYERIIN